MQHQQVCPDCGSSGTVLYVAEIGQTVCSNCATVSHDLQIYEPTNVHEVAYALGAPQAHRASSSYPLLPAGPAGRFWSNDREHHRRLNDLQRKPEVDARIQGTLNTLGYPGLFDQVEFLFRRARDESWRRPALPSSAVDEAHVQADPSLGSLPASFLAPRVKWGNGSLLLATACCYAVLRREGACIDLTTVANAAQLPLPKVRTAFRRLHVLVKGAVRDIKLANPDTFVRRIVAFFYFHLVHRSTSALAPALVKFLKPFQHALPSATTLTDVDTARFLHNTPFEAVENTALDLCAFWWPTRTSSPSSSAQLAAFAIVVFALEAHTKAPAPMLEIFRYTHAALEFDLDLLRSCLGRALPIGTELILNKTAVDYYRELCVALKAQAAKIPWLSEVAPISKKSASKKRHAKQAPNAVTTADASCAASLELARLDVIVHALDILDVWRTIPSKHSDVRWSGFRLDSPPAPPSSGEALACHGSADRVPSGDEDPDEAMGNDDLDCFVSSSPPSNALAEGQEPPARTSLSAADDEVWPRIQHRLEAVGALKQKNEPDEHPIDLLTDDQVDEMLFESDELAALFRVDKVELAAFERAKIAAGDWPIQADHQRNAELADLARGLEQKSASSSRKVKIPRDEQISADAAPAKEARTDKRRKAPSPSQAPPSSPSSSSAATRRQLLSTTRSSKRPRAAAAGARAKVALREQQEESDWSN
ncbi:hypothetical protein EX895_003019 [Sporisorium graminicola]|uniref:TFIIB-type domain-containing protein n=1 Tax=Sporisorium graminicola TaxID=280036 RepID=A0A4U7KTU5_9BASI|nr:hypothetical protein EX895_003019 [Sporisorium graminicola]TKY87923.1 hypothetical protein EX895_003019 [Sporisorium graminicola]